MLREATIKDIPAIQRIRNSVKENMLSNPSLVPDSDVEDYILNRGKGWVFEKDKKLVGFSIVSVQDSNVWALFIEPGNEGDGIGRALHDIMIGWYFTQTENPVWLGTAPATRAEKFYRKAGWIETGLHGKSEIKFEMTKKQWNATRMQLEGDHRTGF